MSELSAWQKYKQNLGETRPWDLLNKNNLLKDQTPNERLSICLECPKLIKLTTQCKECGCFMTAKTKLINATCPLGKW